MPLTAQWLGGDVGTSLLLPNGQTFWIFGDSFVNLKTKDRLRKHSSFIHNSVALSKFDSANNFQIRYYWGEQDKQPLSFFRGDLESKSRYYWPFSSFLVQNSLFVLLSRVAAEPQSPLGFGIHGVDIVKIRNWHQPVSKWRQEFIPLSDNDLVTPNAAAVVQGQFVYLFASQQTEIGIPRNVLARISIQELGAQDLRSKLKYLKNNGQYLAGTDDLKTILTVGNTELSVLEVAGRWYALQMNKSRVLELMAEQQGLKIEMHHPDQIIQQTAESIEGPWSSPKTIFTVPETDPTHLNFEPTAFAYAAKAHPQFKGSLGQPFLISYVVNSINASVLMQKKELYKPIFVGP